MCTQYIHVYIGTLLSENFLSKFMEWKGSFILIPRRSLGRFPQALQDMLFLFSGGFLKDQLARTEHLALENVASNPGQMHAYQGSRSVAASQFKRKQNKMASSLLQDIVQITAIAASRVKVDATNVQSSLANIYKQAVSRGNESDDNSIDLAPIVNFSESSTKDLRFLIGLFSADNATVIQSMNRSQLLGRLSKFVPYKPANFVLDASNDTYNPEPAQCSKCKRKFKFFVKPQQTCVQCKHLFCNQCPLNSVKLYGFGSASKHTICNNCIETCYQQHGKEWIDRSVDFFKAGTLADLKAALACVTLALSLNVGNKHLVVVGRELLLHGLHEVSLPIVLAIQQQSAEGVDKVKANSLLSSVLKGMAGKFDNWDIQWPLLIAAKEACLLACSETDYLDDSTVEIPNMQSAIKELNGALSFQHGVKEQEQDHWIRKRVQKLEKLWISRDLKSIIELLKESQDDSLVPNDLTLRALEDFLKTKEAYLPKMLPSDSYSLIFLRGVLKLYRQRFIEGVADIEKVAWCAVSLDYLREEAIDILLSLLANKPSLFTLQNLYTTLTTNRHRLLNREHADDVSKSCLPRDLHLLIPDEKELTPPFSRTWPELTVSGLNLRAHHKCEEAFDRQLREGKWGHRDLGFAYINYVQGCNHPAESAVSLLHASLWFLKDFQSKPRMEESERFALKKLVLYCLELAYGIAHMSLHPGMQLYVGCIALKTALEVLSISGNLALPEDTKLVSSLLHTVTYNSRFVPFWKFPPVPVSEAVLLNIISGKMHSQYLCQLKQVNPERRPITEAELCYQLYENDLRYVHPLEDPARAHVQAMEELLHEKGWTMSDVVDLMTSPLSRRDSDGWLVPQPKLGNPQEYAEIKGMVLNLDSDYPSVKLVVVPADNSRGRLGIFSHADFQDLISMVLDEACTGTLFFSLDQPDENKRFHPFQEFRYPSETLQKTNILHTLFETDYLLKSFSVGTEVSAKPPFNQRLNTSGLTRKLPHLLKQKLRPVSDRGLTLNRAHRFWIQADKIVYDEKQTDSTLEFRLGSMDMVVRSHPLIPGKDGKLEDTEKDDDPDSPEAKFAADLTENYNELGLHFPMFLRLRELAKLQVLGLFLRGLLKNMNDKAEGKGVTVPDEVLHKIQRDALQSIKTQLGNNLDSISAEIGIWPAEMDHTTVSTEVRRVLNELPYNVSASYSDVEPHVKSALQQKDQNVISQVVEGLFEAGERRLSRYTLTTYVRSWLSRRTDSEKNDLVNYVSSVITLPDRSTIKRQIVSLHKKQYHSFNGLLKRLRSPPIQQVKNPCKWVPAALRRENDDEHLSLCYGGVLIAPEITQGRVSNFPRHSQHVAVQAKSCRLPSRTTSATAPPARVSPWHSFSRKRSTNAHDSRKPTLDPLPSVFSVPAAAGGSGSPPGGGPPTLPPLHSPSGTLPVKNKWAFTEIDKPLSDLMTIGGLPHVMEILYGGAEDGDDTHDSNSGTRHPRLTVAVALALSYLCINRLLNLFKDRDFKAKSAVEEVGKDTNVNPPCRDKDCLSCSRTRIHTESVSVINTTSGGIFKPATEISLISRYGVYMLQCIKTGKMYVGMTTRKVNTRIKEHLRGITKGRKTNAAHFNALGCFGQFEEFMNISVIGSISEATLKPYNRRERKQITEAVEQYVCELIGVASLINKRYPNALNRTGFELPPGLIRVAENGSIYIDDRLALTCVEKPGQNRSSSNQCNSV